MRPTTTTLLFGLLLSLPAAAQQTTPPAPAAPASTTSTTTATTTTTTETKSTVATKVLSQPTSTKGVLLSSNESPLVAAARRANAARKVNPNKKVWKIDDSMVGHNKGAAATSAAEVQIPQLGNNAPGGASAATMASQPGMSAKERAEKVENLKQEQQKMAAETDEPYGGDVDEDKAVKRSTDIPSELQKLNQPQPPPQEQQHPDSQ